MFGGLWVWEISQWMILKRSQRTSPWEGQGWCSSTIFARICRSWGNKSGVDFTGQVCSGSLLVNSIIDMNRRNNCRQGVTSLTHSLFPLLLTPSLLIPSVGYFFALWILMSSPLHSILHSINLHFLSHTHSIHFLSQLYQSLLESLLDLLIFIKLWEVNW